MPVQFLKKEVRGKEPKYLQRMHASFKYLSKTDSILERFGPDKNREVSFNSAYPITFPRRLLKKIIKNTVLNSIVFKHNNNVVLVNGEVGMYSAMKTMRDHGKMVGLVNHPVEFKDRKNILKGIKQLYEESKGHPLSFWELTLGERFKEVFKDQGVSKDVLDLLSEDRLSFTINDRDMKSPWLINTVTFGSNFQNIKLSGKLVGEQRKKVFRKHMSIISLHTHPINKPSTSPEPSDIDIKGDLSQIRYLNMVLPFDAAKLYKKVLRASKGKNAFTKLGEMKKNVLSGIAQEMADEQFNDIITHPKLYPSLYKYQGSRTSFYGVRVT